MGTYMIPRNTKGEGRILFIFSTKSLIYTAIGATLGIPFYYLFGIFKIKLVGFIIAAFFGVIGFIIGTIKIPTIQTFKITRDIGGESIDDIILRYIKFKRKKNKIYTMSLKEDTKDE